MVFEIKQKYGDVMIGSYEIFKSKILTLSGIDLNSYKEAQMKRRIDALITRNGIASYDEYVRFISANKAKYEEFINYLTINVSEFWRNPEQWEVLEKKVLPQFNGRGGIKVWSAACSTGDEPYSLSMLLKKFYGTKKYSIIATDIDKQVLSAANTGIYNARSLKGLPEEFLKKYFKKLNENAYQVSDDVKTSVTFKQHNLLKDEYPSGCDLIVCRNVLIYFTDAAKNEIYAKFYKALNPGGVLFLGSTEQIINPANFGFTSISSFFYKK